MKPPVQPTSNNKARDIREESKKTSTLEEILAKYNSTTKKTSEEFKSLFIKQSAIDNHIAEKLDSFKNVISLMVPKKPIVIKEQKANETIVNKVPTISTESTQVQVLNTLFDIKKLFPDISAVSKASNDNQTKVTSNFTDIIKTSNEQLKTTFEKASEAISKDIGKLTKGDSVGADKKLITSVTDTIKKSIDKIPTLLPNFKKEFQLLVAKTTTVAQSVDSIGTKFKSSLSDLFGIGDNSAFAIMAKALTDLKDFFIKKDIDEKTKKPSNAKGPKPLDTDIEEKKSGIMKMINGVFSLASKALGPLGGLFSGIIKLLLPFRTLMVGGAFGLVLISFFNFIGDFTKTGEALSKLFSGGIQNILPNLLNVFSTFFEDLTNSFKGSDQLGEYGKVFSDIINNQLVPAFNYLVNDVFLPFITSMKDIFEKELSPRFKAVIEYFQGPAGKSIVEGIKEFSKFVSDVLLYFFKNVLPPILDFIGKTFEALVEAVKLLYPYLKQILVVTLDLDEKIAKPIMGFFTDLLDAITLMFKERNFTGLLKGVGLILVAVMDGAFSLLKNVGDWILQRFGIKVDLGIGDKKLSQIMVDISNAVMNWVVNLKDTVVTKVTSMFTEAANYIEDLHIVDMIKEKLMSFVDSILSIIPSLEDIKDYIRESAKSMYGGETIANFMLGEKSTENPKPVEVVPNNDNVIQRKTMLKSIEDGSKKNTGDTTVVAPVTNTTNVMGGNSRSGSNITGVAKTTQTMTPSDRKLYGTGGGGGL